MRSPACLGHSHSNKPRDSSCPSEAFIEEPIRWVCRNMVTSLLAMAVGLVAGILGSMFGLGGGFLMVPLMNIAGIDMKVAVGTSATAIIFNALSATIAYARYKYIDYRAGLFLSSTAVATAYLGAQLTKYIDVNLLRVLFGIALVSVAYRVAKTGRRTEGEDRATLIQLSPRNVVFLLSGGALAGLASGLLGIGGGVVNVPLLTYLGLPIRLAVATSSMAIALTSVTSAITHYTLGNVDIYILIFLAPTLVVGAQVGAAITKRIRSASLRKGFSATLVFIALRMILKGLGFQIP